MRRGERKYDLITLNWGVYIAHPKKYTLLPCSEVKRVELVVFSSITDKYVIFLEITGGRVYHFEQ